MGGKRGFSVQKVRDETGNAHHKFTFLLYLFAIGLVWRLWVNTNWLKISTQQLQKLQFSTCCCKEDNCPTYAEQPWKRELYQHLYSWLSERCMTNGCLGNHSQLFVCFLLEIEGVFDPVMLSAQHSCEAIPRSKIN